MTYLRKPIPHQSRQREKANQIRQRPAPSARSVGRP